MTDSDMPEILHIHRTLGGGFAHFEGPYGAEYVRADLLTAAEAKLEKAVEALSSLFALNDEYSPFGGEMYRDRVDRTWDNARATLKALKGGDE
jgi:hypothetical protein